MVWSCQKQGTPTSEYFYAPNWLKTAQTCKIWPFSWEKMRRKPRSETNFCVNLDRDVTNIQYRSTFQRWYLYSLSIIASFVGYIQLHRIDNEIIRNLFANIDGSITNELTHSNINTLHCTAIHTNCLQSNRSNCTNKHRTIINAPNSPSNASHILLY